MQPSKPIPWLLAVGCICLTLPRFGGEPLVWFNQPATNWTEALPLGNGRLGAMVFGGVAKERLQLNDDGFWAGCPVAAYPAPNSPLWPNASNNINT